MSAKLFNMASKPPGLLPHSLSGLKNFGTRLNVGWIGHWPYDDTICSLSNQIEYLDNCHHPVQDDGMAL
ncbi:MAG: hypothetical protein QM749_06590 [Aquabacterium sp.]